MTATDVRRAGVRLAITLYAGGLLVWLLLGLLPVLAEHVSVVRHVLESAAAQHSAYGRLAGRVLHPTTTEDRTTGTQTAVQYAFSVVNLALGGLLFLRRPDETVPRLLAFALLGTAATFNLPSHRAFHITGMPWPIALAHFTFHIVSGVTYAWAVLLFPDGRLPRRIALGPRATAAVATLGTAAVALLCWRSSFLAHPQFFVIFFGAAVPALGVGAQVLRLRDGATTASERRTARMLCAALLPAFATALVWGAARLVQAAASGPGAAQAGRLADRVSSWFPVVFAVVPVVLFAAVLRYRLWELDRWLTRVLVLAVLTLAIGTAYVVAVVVGAELSGAGALWSVALVSALLATLVEPLRHAARRWANRVVFGVSLSPEQALHAIGEGLTRLTPSAELHRLVSVAARATRASATALWLVDGGRLVRVAAAAADGSAVPTTAAQAVPVEAVTGGVDAARGALGDSLALPVRHHGDLLGLLTVRTPDDSALPASDRAMLEEIADHAGLLVHNAVLTVGLARRAEQRAELSERLVRARRRLVETQDAERHRLERDLHDGAQQALVAALIGLRGIRLDDLDAADRIGRLQEVLVLARESLAELTGDGPASPVEDGLRAGLERAAALTRRLGITVTVTAEGADPDQVEPEVAAAAYFCCVEALQNVAKHAGATAVRIEVTRTEDELGFAVTDDGVGVDPATLDAGGGLRRLDERLAAVGGRLSVTPAGRHGTRVAGRIPMSRAAAS